MSLRLFQKKSPHCIPDRSILGPTRKSPCKEENNLNRLQLTPHPNFTNAVGELQEWAQAKRLPVPRYDEVPSIGMKRVLVTMEGVQVAGQTVTGSGQGSNTKGARQDAAQRMLLKLVINLKSSTRRNLVHEFLEDKTLWMTQASQTVCDSDKSPMKRVTKPSKEPDIKKIREIFFNANLYSKKYNCLKKIEEATRNWTENLTEEKLESFGVQVSFESVTRITHANERLEIRGLNDESLCLLVLNFDPDYEENSEFQWGRRRRLDGVLIFHGRASSSSEAHIDAMNRAKEHFKLIHKGKREAETI